MGVVRLPDGRELAFKSENLKSVGDAALHREARNPMRSGAANCSRQRHPSSSECRFDAHLVPAEVLEQIARIDTAVFSFHELRAALGEDLSRCVLDLACSGDIDAMESIQVDTAEEAKHIRGRVAADLKLLALDDDPVLAGV